MANIRVVHPEEAEGRLKKIYDGILAKRGRIAEVHKIQSLNPDSMQNHLDLYMTVMFGDSPLTREQREMIGVVVSAANGCHYCMTHHKEALEYFWKDRSRCEALAEDFSTAGLNEKDLALGEYAWNLTQEPAFAGDAQYANILREAGFDDRGILDATLVVSYFNFVNRMVLGLELELEDNPGGFLYE
jgi:uncharacterized peroxidase-related enzyme